MSAPEKIEINRGLKGIYFERSSASDIDGKAGGLWYRGYSIHDLTENAAFEEVAFLLIYGELPNATELSKFSADLIAARTLPKAVIDLIGLLKDAHPMDVLRTAVSALGACDKSSKTNTPETMRNRATALTSQIPSIIATLQAVRTGKKIPQADPKLSHAANFLKMLSGQEPTNEAAELMNRDMILHAEHGSNASSFAARVVIGTDADIYAAYTTAISALSGPAHGGAAEDVMNMALEIGAPQNAAAYVKAKRANGEAVTGFGHRVYRTEDPRARHLRSGVEALSLKHGGPRWYAILQAVVDEMKPYARFGVHVNVDFYAGVIYYLNGIPADLFVPIFAAGRSPGWAAQCLEQAANNILIRPLTLYDGPAPRPFIALSQRG